MDVMMIKSVRLPRDLVAEVERQADERGLTFSDLVQDSLAKEFGMQRHVDAVLVEEVVAYLKERYPDKQGFPLDVTLEVFRLIRGDHSLRDLYEEAIAGPGGSADQSRREALHRRLGRVVKRSLGAVVVGRSEPLDPDVELIRSHALLRPEAH